MSLLTFKGGIHPNDGKSLAKDQPIKDVIPTGKMIVTAYRCTGSTDCGKR